MLQKGTKYQVPSTKHQVPHFEDSRASENWSFSLLGSVLFPVSSNCSPHGSWRFLSPCPPSLKTKSLVSSRTTREVVCVEAMFARIFYFLHPPSVLGPFRGRRLHTWWLCGHWGGRIEVSRFCCCCCSFVFFLILGNLVSDRHQGWDCVSGVRKSLSVSCVDGTSMNWGW